MKTTKSGERAAEPQLTKNKHNGGEKKQAPAEGEGGGGCYSTRARTEKPLLRKKFVPRRTKKFGEANITRPEANEEIQRTLY